MLDQYILLDEIFHPMPGVRLSQQYETLEQHWKVIACWGLILKYYTSITLVQFAISTPTDGHETVHFIQI